jgi:hypothetical protein
LRTRVFVVFCSILVLFFVPEHLLSGSSYLCSIFLFLCSITWAISTASSRSSMACECPPKRKCAQALARAEVQHTSAYVSIRQHTAAYVSIRQHPSASVRIRQHMACECLPKRKSAQVLLRRQAGSARLCQYSYFCTSKSESLALDTARCRYTSPSVPVKQVNRAYLLRRQARSARRSRERRALDTARCRYTSPSVCLFISHMQRPIWLTRPSATRICGLELLVHAALSHSCMRP